MTFSEVEDLFDEHALLEKDGRLFRYCSTAAELVREIKTRVFQDVESGEEIGMTYAELRSDPLLHTRY